MGKSAVQKMADAAKKAIGMKPSTTTKASLSTENGNHSSVEQKDEPVEVTERQAALGMRKNVFLEALNRGKKPLTKAVDNSERDNFVAQVNRAVDGAAE